MTADISVNINGVNSIDGIRDWYTGIGVLTGNGDGTFLEQMTVMGCFGFASSWMLEDLNGDGWMIWWRAGPTMTA